MKFNIANREISVEHRRPSPLKCELQGLMRCFTITSDNSALEKITAVIVLLTWSIITISLALEGVASTKPEYYGLLSLVAGLIISKIWNIQVDRLTGVNNDN